jgi:hypothetical protein
MAPLKLALDRLKIALETVSPADTSFMSDQIRLDEDWRVSSTFSGGAATIEESVQAAEDRDLRALCIVDRVRRSSSWVSELAEGCAGADRRSLVEVSSGIEVEVVDTAGRLEMPVSAGLVDHVFVTASLLPTPKGPIEPAEAVEEIDAGRLSPGRAVEWLLRAYVAAASREGSVVLVRPFGVLERMGMDADAIHPAFMRWLAAELAGQGASVVIDESLRCPETWITDCFLAAGVELHTSTGSSSTESVGRYEWCRAVVEEMAAIDHTPVYANIFA